MDVEKHTRPIVVDLGSASRKQIRKLKRGTGQLEEEVRDVVRRVRTQLGAKAEHKELVPLVVVYSRKRKQPPTLIELLLDG
jgi:hypothetical protein